MIKILKVIAGVGIVMTLTFIVLWTPDLSQEDLNKKYTNEASKFIEIQGLNTHYRIEGSGPVLLLIHGTASSLHTWDGWVEELKNDFTLIRLDLPAFGLTGPNQSGNYTIDFYINFIDEFTRTLKLDTFHIAGNSLGGGIAWNYSNAYPEKVNKLILVDAAGYPKKDIPFVFKISQNSLGAALLKKVTPRAFIEKNINEVYYDDGKVTEELVDRYYELTLREGNRQAFVDRAKLTLQYDASRVKNITAPTLILWGKYDEWITVDDAEKFKQDIKNSQLIIYEAGHVPMEEVPKISAADTRKFLQN